MEKESVSYQLPYDNGNKERLSITYNNVEAHQIRFNDDTVVSEIDMKDLDWIIEVLQDIRYIHKENIKNK